MLLPNLKALYRMTLVREKTVPPLSQTIGALALSEAAFCKIQQMDTSKGIFKIFRSVPTD